MSRPPAPFLTRGWLASLLLLAGFGYVCVQYFDLHPILALAWSPVFAVVLILAALAGAMLVGWRRSRDYHRRVRAGVCIKCGYDLRGARHDLCPECGMPVWRPRDPATGRYLDDPPPPPHAG